MLFSLALVERNELMDALQELKEMLRKEQEMIKTLERLLQHAPEGSVNIATTKGYPRYYRYLNGRKSYLGNRDSELVKQLIRKSYYSDMLKEAKQEAKILRRFLKQYAPDGHVRIYERLHPLRQKAVDPLVLPDDAFAWKWLEEHREMARSQPNPFPRVHEFVTLNGENVRSKTEKIIADLLYHLDIPYVYGCPLQLSDGKVYPDFTILNKRTRKVYYLEHFGMMDKPEYAAAAIQKIKRYEKSCYYIGEDLLATWELSDAPLGTKELERMIRKYGL